MNEMIERLAKELWGNSQSRPHHSYDIRPSMVVPEGVPDWQRFVPLARTILETIREPTEEMLTAAAGLTEGEGGPTETWQAMIDAALAE